MLVTICTIRQLPQAFALGDSFVQYSEQAGATVLIGLADDPANLPAGFQSPYPLLPISELLSTEQRSALSDTYTPTEFAAACKPLLIAEAFRRYPDVTQLIYADPNIRFFHAVKPIWDQLAGSSALLTPFITQRLRDAHWPDEKHFQNIGLYSSDFLVFRRSEETDRLLVWWQDRVQTRAYVNFCEGLCTDQLWLMHIPVFFPNVTVIKNPGWHVALWNLPWRTLRQDSANWWVTTPTESEQPMLFANLKGLYNRDEGFFALQTRLRLADRPDVTALLTDYRQVITARNTLPGLNVKPAYGQRPEPVIIRGWRQATVKRLKAITRFIDRLPIPAIR